MFRSVSNLDGSVLLVNGSKFENDLCTYIYAKHAIAVTNGTVALRLALHLVGVRADDEVIMPPLSFVATANAVSHLRAIPHFVDVDNITLAIDPNALHSHLQQIAQRKGDIVINKNTGRRISAIVPVHVFGNPARIEEICSVAASWNIPVVEDAAEALGSWSANTHCGLVGDIGVISFNGIRSFLNRRWRCTTTNRSDYAHRAKHLSTTAKVPHTWEYFHDEIGWNDRCLTLMLHLSFSARGPPEI